MAEHVTESAGTAKTGMEGSTRAADQRRGGRSDSAPGQPPLDAGDGVGVMRLPTRHVRGKIGQVKANA